MIINKCYMHLRSSWMRALIYVRSNDISILKISYLSRRIKLLDEARLLETGGLFYCIVVVYITNI